MKSTQGDIHFPLDPWNLACTSFALCSDSSLLVFLLFEPQVSQQGRGLGNLEAQAVAEVTQGKEEQATSTLADLFQARSVGDDLVRLDLGHPF